MGARTATVEEDLSVATRNTNITRGGGAGGALAEALHRGPLCEDNLSGENGSEAEEEGFHWLVVRSLMYRKEVPKS